jgi:hypothetical protein
MHRIELRRLSHPNNLTDIPGVVFPPIPLLPGADKHLLARLGFAIPRHIQLRNVAWTLLRPAIHL